DSPAAHSPDTPDRSTRWRSPAAEGRHTAPTAHTSPEPSAPGWRTGASAHREGMRYTAPWCTKSPPPPEERPAALSSPFSPLSTLGLRPAAAGVGLGDQGQGQLHHPLHLPLQQLLDPLGLSLRALH